MRGKGISILTLVLLVAIVTSLATPILAADPWYNTSWAYRKSLTFDNTASTENLLNFPVLVHLDDTNMDWTKVQNSGEDIRFTDSDGETLLSYEIEEWDDTNTADIWVRVPQIDLGSDTDFIYMYYGNDSAADGQDVEGTWNSNFVMVQHLQEASGTLVDSTSNNNDGTVSGNVTYGADGQIGDSIDFDGAGVGHIDIAPALTEAGTIEVYVKVDQVATVRGTPQWFLDGYYQHSANDQHYTLNSGARANWVGWTANVWHYMVLTWTDRDDPSTYEFYSDNVHRDAIGGANNDQILTGIGEDLTGFVDEVRLQNVARSADWIEAQHLSMTNVYITFGSEESSIADSPTGLTLTQVEDYQVYASWVLGVDNTNVMLRRKMGEYPANRVDGVLVYEGGETSINDNASDVGLELDKYVYYYRIWGQNAVGSWSTDYAEGEIGGGGMVVIAIAMVVLGLTTLSFVRKEGMLSAASIIAWMLFTFLMFNQSWPSENEYLGTAAALFGITMVIIMTVVTLNHYLGLRTSPPTHSEIQLAHRKKVLSLTRRKKRRWWEE